MEVYVIYVISNDAANFSRQLSMLGTVSVICSEVKNEAGAGAGGDRRYHHYSRRGCARWDGTTEAMAARGQYNMETSGQPDKRISSLGCI